MLDVGTGTGVLAIAAAKSLRSQIVAGDIDPTAIEVARRNALLNGVGPRASASIARRAFATLVRGSRAPSTSSSRISWRGR